MFLGRNIKASDGCTVRFIVYLLYHCIVRNEQVLQNFLQLRHILPALPVVWERVRPRYTQSIIARLARKASEFIILHAICSVSVQLKYIFFICKIMGYDTSDRENVRKIRIEVSRSLTRQLKPLNFSEFLESDHFTESKKKIFCITE